MILTPPRPTIPRERAFFVTLLVPLALYFTVVLVLLAADVFYVSWEGPRAFWTAVTSDEILHSLELSLVSSTITAALSLVVAVPTGYILSRKRFFGIALVDTILDIPILLPPLVVGLSLLVVFSTPVGRAVNDALDSIGLGIVLAPGGIVVAQFVVACAFAIRTMKATFDGIDPRYETVARTLGYSPFGAFRVGSLPLAWSGVVASAVITWARAIGEFGPILILCGATRMRTEVLPTSIYLEVSVGHLHAALSIALMMIAAAVALLLVFKRFGGKAYFT